MVCWSGRILGEKVGELVGELVGMWVNLSPLLTVVLVVGQINGCGLNTNGSRFYVDR